LAILITIVASICLEGQEAERAIFLGAVFSALTIFIDLFVPEGRLAAPAIMQLGLTTFLVIAASIFGIVFVRQFQLFRVAARLSALILMIALPVVAAIAIVVTSRAGAIIEDQANQSLRVHYQIVNTTLNTWLDLHGRALTELASLPDITSMDPQLQRPALVAMAKAYPNLFLVQTTDLNGINIARNDGAAPKDYHDRNWFLGAKSGAPITLEALISRTNGKPALNMSTPIRDASGRIIGVASIVSTLDDVANEVISATGEGKEILIFVVDNRNNVIAHPDPALTEGDNLHDFSNYPPVAAMRKGTTGIMDFTDENGTRWRAYIYLMDNGWGVISQEPINLLLAPLYLFQKIAIVIGMVGLAILLSIAWLTIRRTLKPIEGLTGTVEAVTAGDLTRMAEVTSGDEIGILGEAFNKMTAQIRELIG